VSKIIMGDDATPAVDGDARAVAARIRKLHAVMVRSRV
jgi:hypothetical protein